ncbi:MAG: M20/M25/M40 family metallo-hydrolase [Planctomycetota bacterium]|nr:M20/M25/M40 family metallo-hydrolase [Planctomycetota bacterium]
MNDLELLQYLIECPSLSGEEGPYASLLATLLREEGFVVEVDESSNVYAFDGDQATRVAFSTHIDTVPPFFPPRLEGDLVYGRGACDTKGGLVSMIMASRRLRTNGFKGLGFVLVVEEETTHDGARLAAQHPRLKKEQPHFILCEPTGNRVVRAQKGVLKIRVRSVGKAAHSAYPDRGHSAIHDLVAFLGRLAELKLPSDLLLGPTTYNIGLISGGVAANVFAPEAEAVLMIRLTRPIADVLAVIEGVQGNVQLEIMTQNDPVHYDPPEGFESCEVSFNTDAHLLKEVGEVWLVGPGEIEVAHSAHEHIKLSELRRGIDLYHDLALLAAEKKELS